MKTNERLFRVFQTREDWLLHSESLFIFFIFNVVILSFAGRRSRTYGPVRYLPSFTVHLLKLTGVIIPFKILAKKSLSTVMSLVKRVSIRANTVVCLYWLQIIISGGCEIIFIDIGTKLPFQENFCTFIEYIRKYMLK